jgi:hypothetical protein
MDTRMVKLIRLSSRHPSGYEGVSVVLPISMNVVWYKTENACTMLHIAESGVEVLAELKMHESSDPKKKVESELKAKKGVIVPPGLS